MFWSVSFFNFKNPVQFNGQGQVAREVSQDHRLARLPNGVSFLPRGIEVGYSGEDLVHSRVLRTGSHLREPAHVTNREGNV